MRSIGSWHIILFWKRVISRLCTSMGYLAQPARVQQQYLALERVLRDCMEAEPTRGTSQLAKSLREEAGARAAIRPQTPKSQSVVEEMSCSEADFDWMSDLKSILRATQCGQDFKDKSSDRFRTRIARGAAPLLVLFVLLAILSIWNAFHPVDRTGRSVFSPASASLLHNQEKWVYCYAARNGEKPNSEGTAVVCDAAGMIYVTGLIETDKEDTDILTLKLRYAPGLTPERRLVWAQRFSSREHDCDRAYSLCLGDTNRLYVGGETYVPDAAGKPGGMASYTAMLR